MSTHFFSKKYFLLIVFSVRNSILEENLLRSSFTCKFHFKFWVCSIDFIPKKKLNGTPAEYVSAFAGSRMLEIIQNTCYDVISSSSMCDRIWAALDCESTSDINGIIVTFTDVQKLWTSRTSTGYSYLFRNNV